MEGKGKSVMHCIHHAHFPKKTSTTQPKILLQACLFDK